MLANILQGYCARQRIREAGARAKRARKEEKKCQCGGKERAHASTGLSTLEGRYENQRWMNGAHRAKGKGKARNRRHQPQRAAAR